MKIGTYNTYFDPYLYLERFKHILFSLKDCDIICLQEIPTGSLMECEKLLIENGFLFQVFLTSGTYGILTASKIAFEYSNIEYYSRSLMGRGFIHVRVKHMGSFIEILNTHLESMYKFQVVRDEQMKQLVAYCLDEKIIDRVILCGDLNIVFPNIFTLEKYFTARVTSSTWFGERFSNSNRKCPFDRIYTGKCIQMHGEVEIVGNTEISKLGCYPSDHDGLICKVE